MNVYIDSFHFMPFVYQQFNDLLLYRICKSHVWNLGLHQQPDHVFERTYENNVTGSRNTSTR